MLDSTRSQQRQGDSRICTFIVDMPTIVPPLAGPFGVVLLAAMLLLSLD